MSHSETLLKYNTLASHSIDDAELLGCALPNLTPGRIEAQRQTCIPSELTAILAQWQHAQGWYQSRAQIGLGIPTNTDYLIEGQWFQADQSLHLILNSEGVYQLTFLSEHDVVPGQVVTQCYSEQRILLRPSLKDQYDALSYRLWWQQAETGPNEGGWRPLLQQFRGLVQLKEQ